MAKDVIFQQKKKGKSVVGTSKQTKLLRTNLQGGGTCDWVPEDETQLIPKVITQDGVYKASEEIGNIYGYSEVTVQGIGSQVMGDLGTITIYKNGTYYAKTAYSPSDLGASNDGGGSGESYNKTGPFYGYKTVIVNVSGGSSGGSSDGGGSSGGSSSGGGSSGSGQSVVGKDSDGNYVQWKVGEDGVLREEKLASSIRITTKPKFLTYKNGDSINFKGIKVTAYVGNEVYKSDSHPNGIISESELMLSEVIASGGNGSKQSITVTWPRDVDGFFLETTLEITVNNA